MSNAGVNGLLEAQEREKAKLYVADLSGLKDEVTNTLQAMGQAKEDGVSAILENRIFAEGRDGKRWMRPAHAWAHEAKAEIAEYLGGDTATASKIVIATVVEISAGQMLESLRDIQRFSTHTNGRAAKIYEQKIKAKEGELKFMGAQLVEDMEEVADISRITMGNAVDRYMDGMKTALRDARAHEHVAGR